MFPQFDFGAELFKTWNDDQRRDEITRLVEGFRNGIPLGVLCKMAETIAGSREKAREHLLVLMSSQERQDAVTRETGGMRLIAEEMLLEES
jgi:hypothetical protein